MLGRVSPQGSLLAPDQLFSHLVSKGSFYERLAAVGPELISDDDFAGMYAPTEPGGPRLEDGPRPARGPSRDRGHHHLSVPGPGGAPRRRPGPVPQDRPQGLRRGAVPPQGPGPHRLLPGPRGRRGLRHLRTSASSDRQVVRSVGEDALSKALWRALKRYLNDTKPDIDWGNPGVRRAELRRMVEASRRRLAAVADRPEAARAAAMLGAIVDQDVEIDPETGEPRIRRGVAAERIVSVTDPEMRHGRKSASRRFDGHKLHLIEEESTEIVLAVDVGPGNGSDGDHAAPLVEQAREAGVRVDEVVGDMAYGDGDTRAEVEAVGAKVVAKVPPTHNSGYFAKTEFTIDPDAPSATCPAGVTATRTRRRRDDKGRATVFLMFDENVCAACPLRPRCVKGRGGRTIAINVHEARLVEARAQAERPAVKRKLRRRAVIERKIDHLQDLGAKKARYRGRGICRLLKGHPSA